MTSAAHDTSRFATQAAGRAAPRRAGARVVEGVRDYWSARAGTFDEGESRVTSTEELRSAWCAVFGEVLGAEPLEILDVGSGTGEVALLLNDLGHHVQGVDLSPGMVDVANRKARDRCEPVFFSVADATALPYPDASFDAIHARHLMWTLPDPAAAVAEWMRVLKPGGKIVITESRWTGCYGGRSRLWRRRARAAVAAFLRALRISPAANVPDEPTTYPEPGNFPFYGGLTGAEVCAFLESRGLREASAIDVARLRMMGRKALPWYRTLFSQKVRSYYIAWARKA